MKTNKWLLASIIVAVLAAFFSIMQEVWIGNALPFVNAVAMGSCAGICLAFCVEIIKKVFSELQWSWYNVIYGSACGIVAAFIIALLV